MPSGQRLDLLDDAAIVRLHVAHSGQIGRQVEQPESWEYARTG